MRKNYSYKPARPGTGNMGKLKHGKISHYSIKLYTLDTKLAQKHLAALKKLRTTAVKPPVGQVPPIEPNPGNPLQFPVKVESCEICHDMMSKFHVERSNMFLDLAKTHAEMGILKLKEFQNDEDLINLKGKPLPSTYDIIKEDEEHYAEAGVEYHSELFASALMEANHFLSVAESIKEALETVPGDQDPEETKEMMEEFEVCKSLYSFYSRLAEMHSLYVGYFDDYLKRRADQTFNYEPDNRRDNPPTHSPDNSPFAPTPPQSE